MVLHSRLLKLTIKYDSEVSKAEGRIGQTTNMVLGGTITGDSTTEWLGLNEMVMIVIWCTFNMKFLFELHLSFNHNKHECQLGIIVA